MRPGTVCDPDILGILRDETAVHRLCSHQQISLMFRNSWPYPQKSLSAALALKHVYLELLNEASLGFFSGEKPEDHRVMFQHEGV